MNDPRRLFRYVLTFAGLVSVLYALTGLLGLAITLTVLQDIMLSTTENNRVRASLYLAELIVGLPVWLALWTVTQRRAGVSEERGSTVRRVFLGATFALTSVVALFALHTVLRFTFSIPGTREGDPSAQDAAFAAARLIIFGAAWLYHARIGWMERGQRQEDEAHDLAVAVLASFSLAFLATGVVQALGETLRTVLESGQPVFSGELRRSIWDRWGAISARILSGGMLWGAIWQYDLHRGGVRRIRVGYLYLVLLFAVPTALGSATAVLHQLLRRGLGYTPIAESTWQFLVGVLPLLLVSGVVWAHHWAALRGQPAPAIEREVHVPGTISWPRRPGIALLVVLGLSMVAVALVSIIWLALDFVLNTGDSLSGGAWWRDRVSWSVAAALVGSPAWLGAWNLMQRAASAEPARERAASERRKLLGFVVLASALAAIGFAVSLLWLLLQMVLGADVDTGELSRMLKNLSAVFVALGVGAYHGQTLRHDLAYGTTQGTRVKVSAFVAPGAEPQLARLRAASRHSIDVVGYLAEIPSGDVSDLSELEKQLAGLGAPGGAHAERALLLLGPSGGSIHPYSHNKPTEPDDVRPVAAKSVQPG